MADLTDKEIIALAEKHGAFNAGDARGWMLWSTRMVDGGGLLPFARELLALAAGVKESGNG